MKCPYCNFQESKVIDSRTNDDADLIRRRRQCLKCSRRFTTYEKHEVTPLIVIKKEKTRQTFDSNKILSGMLKACEKRPISIHILEKAVSEIEEEARNISNGEIQSKKIGYLVMKKLKEIDDVAYVRFASVYKEFKDINEFMEELKNFKTRKKEDKDHIEHPRLPLDN